MPTCLIVDDSRVIRKVSRHILEDLKFDVAEAENGQEGLEYCRETKPDVVLLDWNMPVMSGIEFVRALRVDDSLTVRTIFSRMITSDHKLELAATAKSGEEAIEKIAGQAIDVILLDLEMPGMGGLKALPQLLDTTKGVQILVVSSLTDTGAEHTLRALAMGAADTMLKPRRLPRNPAG